MHVELIFALHLWYGSGSGEEIVEIFPSTLSANMLRIINDVIYPYHPIYLRLDGSYVHIILDYPQNKLLEIGSWLDGIDVNGNAPDLWMEGNLDIPEYPEAEFVPTLVSCKMDF